MNTGVKIKKEKVKIDIDNPSLQRIDSRCINCGMCLRVCENVVGLDHKYQKKDIALCVNCGQCIMNCPTGALCTKYSYKEVLNLLNDTNKKVAISIAPAVRVAFLEEFGLESGMNSEKMMPGLLRKLGFDYVFDVSFGADVTVMEEASELLYRLKRKENLPLFTSCCPSWVKYAEMFHPELIDNLSTTKSPIGIQSTLIKTYFKQLNEIEDEIISVVVAPCTSKKYEIQNSDTDYIITTQELAMMVRECKIKLDEIPNEEFDKMLGESTKAAINFGRSAGVMEAVLNTTYYMLNKKNAPKNYFKIDIEDGITKCSFKMGVGTINVAVIFGMKNLEEFLPEIENYDIIEVMNCPFGCVGGGGQPLTSIRDLIGTRKARVTSLSESNRIHNYSHENTEIKDLYRCFLDAPLSQKSIDLLHTSHKDKTNLINKDIF